MGEICSAQGSGGILGLTWLTCFRLKCHRWKYAGLNSSQRHKSTELVAHKRVPLRA